MKIDAITTCVGERYANYLNRTLESWLESVDTLTIATKPRDPIRFWSGHTRLRIHQTEAFGEFFNKGAALNEAYNLANPTDWVLAFDCDMVPPKDWRLEAEGLAKPTHLNGAFRVDENGANLDSCKLFVKGYFQLWNVNDPHFKTRPVFADWCEHAGRYDTLFAKQWPRRNHNDLGFKLLHQGEKSKYWFGPDTTQSQMKKAFQQALSNRTS